MSNVNSVQGYRKIQPGIIINNDKAAFFNARKIRAKRMQEKEKIMRIPELEKELNELKKTVSELTRYINELRS